MKKIGVILITVVLALSFSGCAGKGSQPETVDIRGVIKEIIPGTMQGTSGSILVEGKMEEDTKVDKAMVTITKDTKIILLDNENKSTQTTFSALQKGQTVEVVFQGPVRESYPVQANAKTVLIKSQGASAGQDDKDPNASEELKDNSNQVSLSLDKEAYKSSETMKLVISNNNLGKVSFGRPFSFQQYKDGKWTEYPLELFFTLELILLDPGKTFDQTVSLTGIETGKYRIVKDFGLEGSATNFKLAKEFEVKN